ncbi:MAG: AAA family ATPase [Nitriliruptoraceae bacterium]|nr:AAA family ATPase [Nitriliruptoraceae bacterium]
MAPHPRSARFVGRADELARLEQALARAVEGSPTTVLLGGDAGAGKTRLIEEFTRRCRGQGARVLTGGCLGLGDGGLPYGAVTAVLRELATDIGLPELRRLAGSDARELARLAPGLRPVDWSEGQGERRGWELDASSQLRLFEGLLGLMARLAARSPLVVVLEDVHWADTSTRDLLVFLAHNLQQVGMVVVATYRTDELHRQHPLRPVLARILRGDGVERVEVAPFTRDELAALLEGILGDAPHPTLLERVFVRSEGNAFFAEELLAAGEARDAELPESLRDILLVTIDGLPPEAVEVLRIVAAAGGTARHGLVATVGATDDASDGAGSDRALRIAVERGVLVADAAAGTYTFRHALLSEAVYSTLLPGEVERLHDRLAGAIEADPSLASRSAAAELAVHWEAAEDQPRALSAFLDAAREAVASAGPAEAHRHVERALELWSRVDDAAERTGMDLGEVTQWAAELSYLSGDPGRAVALQERALAGTDRDPARQAMMFERLGRFRWEAGDSPGAEAAYTDALRRMPGAPPSAARARVLSGYSQFLMVSRRRQDAEHYGRQALTMAREVGARAVEGHALNTLGTIQIARGDDRGLALLRDARAIAEELGAAEDIMRSYYNEVGKLNDLGRFNEAVEIGLEGLERARAYGAERQWAGHWAHLVAIGAFYAGRWELANELMRAAPGHNAGIGAGYAHVTRAYLAAARGEVGLASRALAAAERFGADVDVQSREWFVAVQVALAVLERDADEARRLMAARPPALELGTVDGGLTLRAHLLRALADLGISDPDDPALPDRVLAECRALASTRASGGALGSAGAALVEAEYARVRDAADQAERWSTVIVRCDGLGMVHDAAYGRYRLAETMLDDGARDAAADLLRSALDAAGELGARPLEDAVVALARRARIYFGAEAAATPVDELGLTPRETEVLLLVADGRTNPQIAERLYISAKTASVHVSNILRKLEVSNRGEAAALAHRHGLTIR